MLNQRSDKVELLRIANAVATEKSIEQLLNSDLKEIIDELRELKGI